MEVSKKGQISYAGDLITKGNLSASELKVASANVSNDVTINGDLIVMGSIRNKDVGTVPDKVVCDVENKKVNTQDLETEIVYFSKMDETGQYPEGTWRIRCNEGELLIEHLESGVWEIRQSMV